MSGFDVAEVSYSEQQTGERHVVTRRNRLQVQFFNFLHEYEEQGQAIYDERIRGNYEAGIFSCEVDYTDLTRFNPDLAAEVVSNPSELLHIMEEAAKDVVHRSKLDQDRETLNDMQILIVGYDRMVSLRALHSTLLNQLVSVSGIVVSATRASTKAVGITLQCRNCKTTRRMAVNEGFGGAQVPRNCNAPPPPNGEKCPLDPFVVLPDQSAFIDIQTLKLQESPESVPTGEMPRTLQLHVSRHLVNQVKPGTRCAVVGILSVVESRNARAAGGGPAAASLRMPYLRVVGLKISSDGAMGGSRLNFSVEDEEQIKEIARHHDIYQRLAQHIIAPEIWGREDIKKAVACQLFGGVRQVLPDGVKLRGDIHVLLLGDPSVAKSQFLKFAEKCSPVAVYTSGKGSSAAGLTASVIRDVATGEFHLEGGALVLADGGIVCIDEFDKMRPQDRVAIHEAMEQQTISIAKAGITTTLNSRAGVLAAANPAFGRYDDMKSPEENIEFQSTILSRFDMIFIIQDKRDAEQDRAVTQHVLRLYQQGAVQANRDTFQDELFRDMATLKRYVAYARARCQPVLSEGAHARLVNSYVKFRGDMRKEAAEKGASVIPLTVRQLEAIIRITESLARMQLENVASEEHVEEALRLFQVSTMSAARSGAVSAEGLGGSNFGDAIRKAEARIKRRVAIGATAIVRTLIRELVAAGEDEAACRRALDIMAANGQLQYEAQRRQVRRVGN